MGGEATGCSETTTDVLIELALWDEINIAQTGRKLGINSDARYRFERGVDPAFMLPGLELATQMVLDLCGGTPSEIVVAGDRRAAGDASSIFRCRELKRLAGLELPLAGMRRVLERLGFFVAGQGERVKVAVPSWRPDVHGKADIVEELVRIVGVDRVPSTPFDRGEAPRKPVLTPIQIRTRKAKRALGARDLVEAVTWSFISKPQAELFGGGKPELALANPIAADLSDMRPSLIPGLVAAAQNNADRGFADVALFEVGQIFSGDQPQDQFTAAAGVRRALAKPSGIGRHWSASARRSRCLRRQGRCVRRAGRGRRADAGAANRARRAGLVSSRPQRHHPDRSAECPRLFRRTASARAGSARCRRSAGRLRSDPGTHPGAKAKPTRAKPMLELSPFQPVERDFAFVVDRKRQGRRHRARGAERRPQADHRRHRVRRLRGQGHRAGQEIDRHRGHACSRATKP